MIKKLNFDDIQSIINSLDSPHNFNDPYDSSKEEELRAELEKYINTGIFENKAVLGIEIRKFIKFGLFEQSIIPFVFCEIISSAVSFCINQNKSIFINYHKEDFKRNFKIRESGGYYVFDNPLMALIFIMGLEINLKAYNSFKIYPNLRNIIGCLDFHYAITYDKVFGFNNYFYGNGIGNNSRIINRESGSKCIIDKAAYEWLIVNV